jgi:hypothetical protein
LPAAVNRMSFSPHVSAPVRSVRSSDTGYRVGKLAFMIPVSID